MDMKRATDMPPAELASRRDRLVARTSAWHKLNFTLHIAPPPPPSKPHFLSKVPDSFCDTAAVNMSSLLKGNETWESPQYQGLGHRSPGGLPRGDTGGVLGEAVEMAHMSFPHSWETEAETPTQA